MRITTLINKASKEIIETFRPFREYNSSSVLVEYIHKNPGKTGKQIAKKHRSRHANHEAFIKGIIGRLKKLQIIDGKRENSNEYRYYINRPKYDKIKSAAIAFQAIIKSDTVKLILFFISMISTLTLNAQVTETVNFDNYVSATNNDYVNRFTEPYGITGAVQITDSGITGGCLRCPNTFPPSTQSIFCAKYTNIVGATFVTSLSFRWDTSLINPLESIMESASIRLIPSANPNDYIIGYIHPDMGLYLYNVNGGGWDTTSGITPLVQEHWYNLVLTTNSIGGAFDEISVTAQVYELGISGTSSPALINSVNATVSNSVFFADTDISIDMIGAAWGGCPYLDNFSFNGFKSSDSCTIATSVPVLSVTSSASLLDAIPNPSNGSTKIGYQLPPNVTNGTIELYSTDGRLFKEYAIYNSGAYLELQANDLTPGVYYYTLKVPTVLLPVKKLIVVP